MKTRLSYAYKNNFFVILDNGS